MRRPTVLNSDAPPERLAAFRIITGVFALAYLALRMPTFLQLTERDAADFDGTGLASWLSGPVPSYVVAGTLVLAFVGGAGYVSGTWFRITGPVFALSMLALTTYRSSWGQLLHFENLMVLHLLVVAFAGSADAWSLDEHHRRTSTARRFSAPLDNVNDPDRPGDYAAPMRLACIMVVVAYQIAGVAKLRYGGLDWIVGDTLRNHVAYSAARLDVLGGSPSPLARPFIAQSWIFPPLAATAVIVELAAPIALLGGKLRDTWVFAAWLMHLSIAALMLVAFPYPLFLVAFAPFFPIERGIKALTIGRPQEVAMENTG